MGANLSGQSVISCGHASQVASCGPHSAGIRNASETGVWILLIQSAKPAVCDRRVRVNAPVAEKRPVAPDFIHLLWITFHDQHFFLMRRGLHQHSSERIGYE